MKKLVLVLGLSGILVCSGCNSCNKEAKPKYKVLQLYGGWKARADEIKQKVVHIEEHYREYTRYDLDSLEIRQLSTEYPYWKELRTYTDDTGLRKAELYANPKKGLRIERFYFDEGTFIYATILDGRKDSIAFAEQRGEEYFLIQNTLVLALDEAGEKRDITNKKVRLAGLDLQKEAKQIKTIIANKQITY